MVGERLQKADNRCRRQLMLCRARQGVGHGRKAHCAMGGKDLSLNNMGNLKCHQAPDRDKVPVSRTTMFG